MFIPDNPPERSYKCPGCSKGIRAYRVGGEGSCSYFVMDADNIEKAHKCSESFKKGTIDRSLLGYREPKERF